ncbi:YbhB/YbcL family Raf kinase inhibitor-like protein [Pyxidicoccus parkwayensis]|uniref:YbhB/YbcL family Raf kinase inhibitor-like protein n=1 Tax=Pyxidicoccus parkwayensis TaxID=2813578 RepID=A0ABX7NU16_9BACT|nr:YbhB/YbcL family Raf kinase inhibitor-like protein [Pyxidicoccus parkwaysis]QSQ20962.1 YbhB/YbcL family Raf kinase inhibitor-like protein [Pyxidicoccus parkwaysis]
MPKPLALTSPRFKDGDIIPIAYTGEGEDLSPPLQWSNPPAGTKSLALIVEDPDAPDPQNPQMTWSHWVVYNIPPGVQALPEGANPDVLPAGARQGMNDWNRQGYGGPMPPVGRHRYYFRLYALDIVLPDLGRPTRKDLLAAMKGHILGEAELIGLYQKVHHRSSEPSAGAPY